MVAHSCTPSMGDAETGQQASMRYRKPPVFKRKQFTTGLHLILSTSWEFYAVPWGQVPSFQKETPIF